MLLSMEMGASNLAEKVVEYTFYAVFFIVPIIWLPVTNELFEFNKMIVVYLGTSVILAVWALKSIEEKQITLRRTPVDIPIVLFVLANILSTIFSIDRHTSIFGYYTRLNGGLLSTFSYIILFYAFVTFFNREKLLKALKVLVASSAVVTLYAILQHPNPFFRNPDGSFRGIDAGYWRQNSEARVFSTLGHPNWLAAFILMLTPFGLYLLTLAKNLWIKTTYLLLLIGYFLAFTFTYSRGGTLGFIAMLAVLVAGLIAFYRKNIRRWNWKAVFASLKWPKTAFFVSVIIIGWILTLFLFENAFTSRGLDITSLTAQGETQLASEGAETGKIRLIVWKGGLEIFRNFPLFGSGVETFTYSYYLFRPTENNLTGEWDFLYNKAHNEFINYLSTTGIVGFTSYMLIIITIVTYLLKKLWAERTIFPGIFYLLALSSYAGYLVQNFFSFSIVPIALLFFLIPAFVFVAANPQKNTSLKLEFLKNSTIGLVAKVGTFFLGAILISGSILMWTADYYYTTGISTNDLGKSYQDLKFSTALRPDEPLYKAALGLTTISLAVTNMENISKERLKEGFDYLNQATNSSPNNLNILEIRLDALKGLAALDQRYLPQMVETAEKIAVLAPTEAKKQYDLASAYTAIGDIEKSQKQLEKVVELKFNYQLAWESLLRIDKKLGDSSSLAKHKEDYESIFKEADANQLLEN